jgi:TetR/AcrR family transcriptional regulator, regulator of autoinduction and epiphytic fitness
VSTGAAVPPGRSTRVRVDGRTARAQRTRRAMVDALLELIAEGDLKASPERIVERAGVSLRTLWTNFKDLEGLYAAANARLIEVQREVYRPIPPTAPLPERIVLFCEQRGRLLELAAPAARASQLRLPYSAQLRRNRAVFLAIMRDELDQVFPAELDGAGQDRDKLVRALLVNTSWSAWSLLRDELGLDIRDATAVMTRAVTALLAPRRS